MGFGFHPDESEYLLDRFGPDPVDDQIYAVLFVKEQGGIGDDLLETAEVNIKGRAVMPSPRKPWGGWWGDATVAL
jgi:hypothetical protein